MIVMFLLLLSTLVIHILCLPSGIVTTLSFLSHLHVVSLVFPHTHTLSLSLVFVSLPLHSLIPTVRLR